jgi:putative FmdB family regulatory protein
MPLYEYLCRHCGDRFTLLQSMSASREGHECPACGSRQTARAISSFACCGGEKAGTEAGCGPAGGRFR